MASDSFGTELDAHRERVERPLWRLFRAYAPGRAAWLSVGQVASVLAYGTVLVTPVVLGTTIDAVFAGESAYTLPFVPASWLPTDPAAQFRLSTGKDADEIVVLDDGRVAERGTHEELLAADGLYANRWGVQAGEIESLPATFLARATEGPADGDA